MNMTEMLANTKTLMNKLEMLANRKVISTNNKMMVNKKETLVSKDIWVNILGMLVNKLTTHDPNWPNQQLEIVVNKLATQVNRMQYL